MFRLISFWFALHVLLSCQIQIGTAVVFDEYEPYQPGYGNSSLDLQDNETFFWIGPNNSSLGNLTVSMPGGDENIIALRSFRHWLKSIQCTNSSVELTFNDTAAYSYAKDVWKWVNVEKNNTFVLVVGKGDCGWNPVGKPFVISTTTFDDSGKTVNLQGNISTWKNVAHTYELWVGKLPSLPSKLKSRDISTHIDFNHLLPGNGGWTLPLTEDASLTIDCPNCGTYGSFELELHIKETLFIPTGASVILTANGVGASITPELGITANFTNELGDEISMGTIPIDSINIPGVLEVGPEFFCNLGYSIGPVRGSAHISSGVSISIPDKSNVDIGIVPPGISASGWTPTLTHTPMVVDAELSADFKVYFKIGLELSIEALGSGFVASTYLKPFLGASLSLIESVGGAACPDDPKKHPIGVKLAPSVGIDLDAEADEVKGDKTSTLTQVVIASATAYPGSACFGVA